MTKIPVSVSWSGGKDSAFMLYHLLNDERYEIVELHTAVSTETNRVSMHGISKDLIQGQAASIGLPVHFIPVEPDSTNANYEKALNAYYSNQKMKGVDHIGFGDIFLEDLKTYRDHLLQQHNLTGIYPLWQRQTDALVEEFLALKFKTLICCARQSLFPASICGKVLTREMINAFDQTVDPCGENGEFHSFVFDGPIFKSPVSLEVTDTQVHTYEHKLSSGEIIKTVYEFADVSLKHAATVAPD